MRALLLICLLSPVDAPVETHFAAPRCAYCPGQRGIEYAVDIGTAVRAASGGRVTFAGVVAGVRYVVVAHADGLRATYGLLASSDATAGEVIAAGDIVGRSTARLYFGLRRGDEYIDPEPYLATTVWRARLVPADGSAGRPARMRSSTCATASGETWPRRR